MTQLRKTLAAACAAIGLLAACEAKSPPPAPTTPISAALDSGDIKRLDTLLTPATIFPDPAQRALYEMHTPTSDNGRRIYAFELKVQPGMVANRHFHLITITWAGGGAFVGIDGEPPIKSTFGPGGGFIDVVAQTADRRFDVQVSEAMLLPETVEIPPFDLTKTAALLVQSYGRP